MSGIWESSWVCHPFTLRKILEILASEASKSSYNEGIEELRKIDDFPCYLAHVAMSTTLPSNNIKIRKRSGMILEELFKDDFCFLPNVKDCIISHCIEAFSPLSVNRVTVVSIKNACKFWNILALEDQKLVRKRIPNLIRVVVKEMEITNCGEIVQEEEYESYTDEDDEDDIGVAALPYGNWRQRLRICHLLAILKDTIGPAAILSILKENICCGDWRSKEASILALGAIAKGRLTDMEHDVFEVVFFIHHSDEQEEHVVRSTTWWTMGLYAYWLVEQPPSQYVILLMKEILLKGLLDNNELQGSACAAFDTLLTHIVHQKEAFPKLVQELEAYWGIIVTKFVDALSCNPSKNFSCLYGAIRSLAQLYPDDIMRLVAPLITRWGTLIANTHEEEVHLIYLLASLIMMLSERVKPVVTTSGIMQHLLTRLYDSIPVVHESSFSLLGALTNASFDDVAPSLEKPPGQIIMMLQQYVNPDEPFCTLSLCYKAVWVIGEIAMKLGASMGRFVTTFHQTKRGNTGSWTPLADLMNRSNMPKILLENTAITLGRLGLVCPAELAPDLKKFAKSWCWTMKHAEDSDAKSSAFKGFLNLVVAKPEEIFQDFQLFCDAVASWANPPTEIRDEIKKILRAFKASVGDVEWRRYLNRFPEALKIKMDQRFSI